MCFDDEVLEVQLPVVNANPISVFFEGESAEAEIFLSEMKRVKDTWRELLADSRLCGCCFEDKDGRKLYLTPSTRNPDWWQLTVLDRYGIPTYHEDYARNKRGEEYAHRMSELVEELARRSMKHLVSLRIRRKGGTAS